MNVYAVVCKSGKLHGKDGQNPMRWLFFMGKHAKFDCDELNLWPHVKCGPHRVAVLSEATR